MRTEKQKANLRPPIRKGEVLNPKGKRKGTLNLKTLIRMALQNTEVVINGKKVPADFAIQMKKIQLALQGNLKAMEMIEDRLEGKPTQKQELTGPNGEQLKVALTPGEIALIDKLDNDSTRPTENEPTG